MIGIFAIVAISLFSVVLAPSFSFGKNMGGEASAALPITLADTVRTTISGDAQKYLPGRLLVQTQNPNAALQHLSSLCQNAQFRPLFRNAKAESLSQIYLFTFSEQCDVPGLAIAIAKTPGVAFAEPDRLADLDIIPNDPFFNLQWGLHNTGQTGGTPDADVDAPEAWDIETGSPQVVAAAIVAVIDNGFDMTHEDLISNIRVNALDPPDGTDNDLNGYIDDTVGWDFVNDDNNPTDDVNDGHGTHVAGIVAAAGNNGVGVTGASWASKIMTLKAGSGGSLPLSAIIEAIIYATDNGADIISMSFGSYGIPQQNLLLSNMRMQMGCSL